jgi:hypothetical protein
MRVLSASEAISPAIERTKFVLFRPFRKGRSWKLAATAYLSTMGCVFIPIPLLLLLLPWIHAPATISRSTFTLIFAGIAFFYSAIMFVFFYIGARLDFVLFDIVLFKAEFVAPVWRKYAPHTWRWIGLKVVFGTVLSVIAGAPLAVWGLHAMPVLFVQPGQMPSPQAFATLFGFYFTVMAVLGVIFLASSLLGNFVLPYIALEDASLAVGLRRYADLIEAEPGQMVLFVIFKVLLGIVALIALEVGIILIEIILAIPIGIIAFLGWLALHHLGPAGTLMMAAGGIVLYFCFFVGLFYFLLGLQGVVIIFFQAYAMYFLGGRYPLLGNLIDQFTPQPYFYPPGFAPPPGSSQLESPIPPPGY